MRVLAKGIPFCACIKLVLPQAAQLEILFFVPHVISKKRCARELILDTLPIYYEVRKEWKEEEMSPAHGRI